MKKTLLLLVFALSIGWGQSTWVLSGRVHPELNWSTLTTKHFNVHYHQGLDTIALRGASIAEQVRPTLLKQMDLDSIPTIDIILTSEDEIMNGFALWTYTTFIWVDQNDAAVWLEDEKWLEQVLSHELQHIVYLHTQKSWLPQPWHMLISGTPGWVIEGLAEYETEKWRPYRADISHKYHVLKNKMGEMDPHHDGFSKLLYWSDRFGDSTIVEAIKYRTKLGIHRFKTGFKKATGISVNQFNEDWRRHMNTYYYGYRAQKELLEETGTPFTLPIKKMLGFSFFNDSTKIAIIGRDDKAQLDVSLFIAKRDSTKEIKQKEKWHNRIEKLKNKKKKTQKDSVEIQKLFKQKTLWKKEEVDFGRFHNILSWSSNGKYLAYSKYHYGKNQALLWDIKLYDSNEKKSRWLTHSQRATYPAWAPDTAQIVFVAHQNNVSNLYKLDISSEETIRLTDYKIDTQITHPAWSPNGTNIAYAASGPDGNMDIYILNLTSGEKERITFNPSVDYQPVWHHDGSSLSFTSHSGGTPNIYTVSIQEKNSIRVTDVGDGIWVHERVPGDTSLFANTMTDVDSVRIIKIDPNRTPQVKSLSMRDSFTRWRTTSPRYFPENIDPNAPVKLTTTRPYRFTRHLKHMTSILLPGKNPFGYTQWSDALGRHLIGVAAEYNSADQEKSALFFGYTNAEHGPLWSISFYRYFFPTIRPYDGSRYGLYDWKNGLQVSLTHPLNFGESLSDNHTITASFSALSHDAYASDRLDKTTGGFVPRDTAAYRVMPPPENGQEGVFSIKYYWTKKRPHRWNNLHPTQGYGVYTRVDHANDNIFGSFNYTQLTANAYVNIPIEKTSLYIRTKAMMISGNQPDQNYVGFTKDDPVYLNLPQPLIDDIFPENHNPRGWNETRLGNRLIFGTLEYRLPIIPEKVSFAIISDFGNVWFHGLEKGPWVFTAGYEARLGLGLFVLSYGEAQTIENWKDSRNPRRYFRLALINPL